MRILTAAVVSADPALRRTIGESPAVSLALELPMAATDVGVQELEALESAYPDLIVVDLGDDVELGMRLVQFLAESAPGRPVLVVGPPPSAELLLETMRAGAAEYLEGPAVASALEEVLGRLAKRRSSAAAGEAERPGRIYTFVGVKGGMGTTMVASNVAVELRRRSGAGVLLADFRFGLGDAAVHLGLEPRFHVVDLIESLHRIDPGLLGSFVESDDTGVKLLSSPGEEEKIGAVEPEQVRDILRYLRTQFAYTVVDAPDPYSAHARAIFAESDRIFLVATPEVSALRNVGRVLPLVGRGEGAKPDDVRLVVNRFVPSRSVPIADIERLVGLRVQRTVTNDYETVSQSINEGTPLVLGRSVVARDLVKLAADLHGEEPAGSPSRAGGWLRLLRAWPGGGRGAHRSPHPRKADREVEGQREEDG